MESFDPSEFDPAVYGPEVARVLDLGGNGQQLLPLTCAQGMNVEAWRKLETIDRSRLFTEAKDRDAALAGLWLYFSGFEPAHELVAKSETAECQLWHAILHRREPDSGNAAYWFRRVGNHPSYPSIARAASAILQRIPEAEFRVGKWDPFSFVMFCERARSQPSSAQERAAMEIQRAEWQIVFDYCARPVGAESVRGR